MMASAVESLQKAILEGQQSLTKLLRKTKVIAANLNLADVEKWVDFELNGYPNEIEPPKYRSFETHCLEARNPVRGWLFAGHYAMSLPARQPITEIQALSEEERTIMPVPPNVISLEGSFGPLDWDQRLVTAGSEFKRIVEAVTNELLQWTIELKRRGIKGEDMNFNDKEKKSASNPVINIQNFHGVLGDVSDSQVTLYDYSSVNQLLLDHQVPKQDRRELEDIMDELKDVPPERKPSLLKRGEDWIVKHKEFLGAGAEAVGKAIGAAMKH